MSSAIDRIRDWFGRFPRLARFVGVAGVLAAMAFPLARLVPRDLVVRYDFGDRHQDVRALRVAYLPVGQDSARAITQRFPDGAEATFDHDVDLAPGPYEVHIRVETSDGRWEEVVRYIDVGRERVVDVDVVVRDR